MGKFRHQKPAARGPITRHFSRKEPRRGNWAKHYKGITDFSNNSTVPGLLDLLIVKSMASHGKVPRPTIIDWRIRKISSLASVTRCSVTNLSSPTLTFETTLPMKRAGSSATGEQ